MSIQDSCPQTSWDLFLYTISTTINGCPLKYWQKESEEEADESSKIESESKDTQKCFSAIGWYLAGQAVCLGGVVYKTCVTLGMLIATTGVLISYAILKDDDDRGKERLLRLKICAIVLGDSALSVLVDGIGIFVPPLAFKIHNLIRERLIAPTFQNDILDSDKEYNFANFKEELKVKLQTAS